MTRGVRSLTTSLLLLALATACSGDSDHKHTPAGLPNPVPAKVAAFDLSAISDKYDLNRVAPGMNGLVTTDRAGNVYMMDSYIQHPEIIRMTPQGVVNKYAQPFFVALPTAMVVRSDGSMVFSDSTTSAESFRVINKNGSQTSVKISLKFQDAKPVGERPDGSLIISEGDNIWSLKDGKAARLYHQSKDVSGVVVDSYGTVYTVPGNLDDVVVIPVGKAPYHVHPSGNVPGSNTPIASLGPTELTPASTGGFYALTEDNTSTEWSVVYVKGSKAVPLADFHTHHNCLPGKQYPAFHNTCMPQVNIAQSGKHVLLLGNLSMATLKNAQPALALNAVTS